MARPEAEAPGARPGPRRRAWKRAALAAAAGGLLLLAGLTAASLAGAPRNSIHVQDERGLSLLAEALRDEGLRVEGLGTGPHALDAFEEPRRTVLVVAGVERSYSPGEVEAVVGFVERGGIAVIADDFGFGDSLGRPFGVEFLRRQLLDKNYAGNLSLVRVNATTAGRNFTLLANVPSSLGFAPDVEPELLAESGLDSYIDLNANGEEDPDDAKGPFPVIAAVPRGPGKAVFVSDPGLLTNGVSKDNAGFLRAFFRAQLPEAGTVAFDESRHPLGPLGAVLGALLAGEVQATSDPVLAGVVGLSGAALAAVLYAGFRAPEDITLHRSRLRDPVHASSEEAAWKRLQRLASRAVADANDLGVDAREAASPQQLAAMARDPALQALLLGQPAKASPQECLQRIRALGRAREVKR